MADETKIDVTEERDVTEATIDHEVETQPETDAPAATESIDEIPEEDRIEFQSMDGKIYVANAQTIDWNATSAEESKNSMRNNLFVIHQCLRELISIRRETDQNAIDNLVETTMNIVVPFLSAFGYYPEFEIVFPDATKDDIAILYCIDAIEVMTKIMSEVRVRGNKTEEETK